MEEKSPKEIWRTAWKPEIHTTDYAIKRIESAKSAKMTPAKIDTTDIYGYFQGNHGKYETFLDYCPCGDFRRSKLPCKHIYRLAMELGLMNVNVEQDVNAIPTPKNERVSLDETIDIVESLSTEAQIKLRGIASGIRSTTPSLAILYDVYVAELINSKIIVDTAPGKYEIYFGIKKKSEIAEFLDSEKIPYNKKAKKDELKQICIERIPERAAKQFGKIICVSIPTKFSPIKIQYYLHRKYDSISCLDDIEGEYKLSLLQTDLPNDDVTEQLIKRGHFIRKSRT